MSTGYHDGSRSLQDRHDTRALADRIDGLLVSDTISTATRPSSRRATCSSSPQPMPRAGRAAPTRAASRASSRPRRDDPRLPELRRQRDVSSPATSSSTLTSRHALHRPRAAATGSVRGHRQHRPGRPAARGVPRGAVRRTGQARAVYPNCPRYIHHYELKQRSRFVPTPSAHPGPRVEAAADWASTPSPQPTLPATPASARCSAAEVRVFRTGVLDAGYRARSARGRGTAWAGLADRSASTGTATRSLYPSDW